MIRRLPAVAALSIPLSCMAAGYGGARGTNSLGEIIHIGGDTADTIYVQKNKQDHEWLEHYDLRSECPTFDAKVLACLPGRRSPLSGVTYRITTSRKWRPCNTEPYFDKSPGEVYVCVKGCSNKRAPRIFYVDPWEC